ncbi:MAG: hypothetical protein WCH44_06690 [Betaproteobacteria bacterium]
MDDAKSKAFIAAPQKIASALAKPGDGEKRCGDCLDPFTPDRNERPSGGHSRYTFDSHQQNEKLMGRNSGVASAVHTACTTEKLRDARNNNLGTAPTFAAWTLAPA